MSASLVGSEMCIRDSSSKPSHMFKKFTTIRDHSFRVSGIPNMPQQLPTCLLYTSDAADDM
eukprot:14339639-Alexandrium_andersonii.AAC.1